MGQPCTRGNDEANNNETNKIKIKSIKDKIGSLEKNITKIILEVNKLIEAKDREETSIVQVMKQITEHPISLEIDKWIQHYSEEIQTYVEFGRYHSKKLEELYRSHTDCQKKIRAMDEKTKLLENPIFAEQYDEIWKNLYEQQQKVKELLNAKSEIQNKLIGCDVGLMYTIPKKEDIKNKDFVVYKDDNDNDNITFYVKNSLGDIVESKPTDKDDQFCLQLETIKNNESLKSLLIKENQYLTSIKRHIQLINFDKEHDIDTNSFLIKFASNYAEKIVEALWGAINFRHRKNADLASGSMIESLKPIVGDIDVIDLEYPFKYADIKIQEKLADIQYKSTKDFFVTLDGIIKRNMMKEMIAPIFAPIFVKLLTVVMEETKKLTESIQVSLRQLFGNSATLENYLKLDAEYFDLYIHKNDLDHNNDLAKINFLKKWDQRLKNICRCLFQQNEQEKEQEKVTIANDYVILMKITSELNELKKIEKNPRYFLEKLEPPFSEKLAILNDITKRLNGGQKLTLSELDLLIKGKPNLEIIHKDIDDDPNKLRKSTRSRVISSIIIEHGDARKTSIRI